MSSDFSFSNDPEAKFPDECRAAILSWADIVKSLQSDELGTGHPMPASGSVKITYQRFYIVLYPDGTFSGRRIVKTTCAPPEGSA